MLAATLASASATARRSPWWSASAAWIVTSSSPPPTPMTSTEPMVTAAMRPAVNPIAPAPISAAADQNSVRRPSARSSRARDHAGDHAPGREGRHVQSARRVAQVELVPQVHDDEPRRRLQVGEPGKHHVRDPGEPIPTELRVQLVQP